jgi:hypothetical protein
VCSWSIAGQAFAGQFGSLNFEAPEGWNVKQQVQDSGKVIRSFAAKGDPKLTAVIYGEPGSNINLKDKFAFNAQVVSEESLDNEGLKWTVVSSKKTSSYTKKTYFVTAFSTNHNGVMHYGYSRSEASNNASKDAATKFIQSFNQ